MKEPHDPAPIGRSLIVQNQNLVTFLKHSNTLCQKTYHLTISICIIFVQINKSNFNFCHLYRRSSFKHEMRFKPNAEFFPGFQTRAAKFCKCLQNCFSFLELSNQIHTYNQLFKLKSLKYLSY